jgi:hypothetical protein
MVYRTFGEGCLSRPVILPFSEGSLCFRYPLRTLLATHHSPLSSNGCIKVLSATLPCRSSRFCSGGLHVGISSPLIDQFGSRRWLRCCRRVCPGPSRSGPSNSFSARLSSFRKRSQERKRADGSRWTAGNSEYATRRSKSSAAGWNSYRGRQTLAHDQRAEGRRNACESQCNAFRRFPQESASH